MAKKSAIEKSNSGLGDLVVRLNDVPAGSVRPETDQKSEIESKIAEIKKRVIELNQIATETARRSLPSILYDGDGTAPRQVAKLGDDLDWCRKQIGILLLRWPD